MEPLFWPLVLLLAAIVLIWWWSRPVHWLDGEGTVETPHDRDLLDTDVGSWRWWLMRRDEAGPLWLLLRLRDWWENNITRRR